MCTDLKVKHLRDNRPYLHIPYLQQLLHKKKKIKKKCLAFASLNCTHKGPLC